MPRYRVSGRVDYTIIKSDLVDLEVDADNEDDAVEEALELACPTEGEDPVWCGDAPYEVELVAETPN